MAPKTLKLYPVCHLSSLEVLASGFFHGLRMASKTQEDRAVKQFSSRRHVLLAGYSLHGHSIEN